MTDLPGTLLLDVNVLVALVDPKHVHHDLAHAWFERTGAADFATCPLTENGLLRVVGHPRYPHGAGSPAMVAPLLAGIRALPGHHFWPDIISLVDSEFVEPHAADQLRAAHRRLLARAGRRQQRIAGHLRSTPGHLTRPRRR